MIPKNQELYLGYQGTIKKLNDTKAKLEGDIKTTEQQLESMKKELGNIETTILLHKGGLSSIETFTELGIALIEYQGEQPLMLNPNQQGMQQQQAPPSPQETYQPQQPITQRAQETFAPKPGIQIGI